MTISHEKVSRFFARFLLMLTPFICLHGNPSKLRIAAERRATHPKGAHLSIPSRRSGRPRSSRPKRARASSWPGSTRPRPRSRSHRSRPRRRIRSPSPPSSTSACPTPREFFGDGFVPLHRGPESLDQVAKQAQHRGTAEPGRRQARQPKDRHQAHPISLQEAPCQDKARPWVPRCAGHSFSRWADPCSAP